MPTINTSTLEEIHKTEHIEIFWEPVGKVVVSTWTGFIPYDEFREGGEVALEQIKQRKASKYLTDTTGMSIHSQETQDWISDDWFPRVITAGLKRLAIVVAKSVVTKLGIDAVMSRVEEMDFVTQQFEDAEEALQWLKHEQV